MEFSAADTFAARLLDQDEELEKLRMMTANRLGQTQVELNAVGQSFPCFEEEAVCTTINELGCGAFGCVHRVKVVFPPLAKSQQLNLNDYHERSLLQRERSLRKALAGRENADLFVAMKVLKENKASNLATVVVEAASWARVPPHPSVVDLIHVEILSGHLVFFSELIEGEDLDQTAAAPLLAQSEDDKLAHLLLLTLQLVMGVEHLHSFGLHHFDVKPANLMLSALGQPNAQLKLCDFGLAQVSESVRPTATPSADATPSVWGPVQIKAITGGSPVYMSPEIYSELVNSILGSYCLAEPQINIDKEGKKILCCDSHDNWAVALSILDMWTSFSSNSTVQVHHALLTHSSLTIAFLKNPLGLP